MKNTFFLAGFMAMALYACHSQEETKTALTQSGLDPQKFEANVDGQQTHLFTLTNKNNMEVCITNFGGRFCDSSRQRWYAKRPGTGFRQY